MNDMRSRIRYSVRSSERLWSDCSTRILNFRIVSYGLRPALLLRSSGFVSVTASMSVRKSSHGTIFLIVSSGSPRALIASSLRSTSKKPFCPMTRSLHPPMTAHGHRVRFVATWREEFFEVPYSQILRGHVDSIARAINVSNAQPNNQGIATVNPIFTWVRLAQRIPVRIHIDEVPPGVVLAAGMTATVEIDDRARARANETRALS